MIEVCGSISGKVYARIFKTYHPDGLYEAYVYTDNGTDHLATAGGLISFGDAKLFVEKHLRGKSLTYKTSPTIDCQRDFLQPDGYKSTFTKLGGVFKLSEQTKKQRKVGSNMRGYSQFGSLIDVAVKGSQGDEFSTKVENPTVKAAMELHKQQQQQAVANEIVQVLSMVETEKDRNVQAIRSARKTEAEALRKLDLLDKAMAHGQKTGNFCPVLRLLGVNVPDDKVPQELRRS